tara:strand:- start:1034 stop:1483 length:450 start_codon:yes stop_codon:yes gene_type:complete
MLAAFKHWAVSAIALAAFVFAPTALAQDTGFHVLDVASGYWGWELPEGEDGGGTCADDPLHIWLSEDRTRFFSAHEGDDLTVEADILSTDSGWLAIRYDGEERLTDAGEPVVWILFLDSRDRFRWIRQDWIGTGRSTYPLVRCDDAQIG